MRTKLLLILLLASIVIIGGCVDSRQKNLFNEDNNYHFVIDNSELHDWIASQLEFDCNEDYTYSDGSKKLYVAFKKENDYYGFNMDELCKLAIGNININVTKIMPDKGIVVIYNRSAYKDVS